MLPVAAGMLILLNRRRKLYFIDHLDFAMHIQAFAFLLVSLLVIVRSFLPHAPLFRTMLLLMIIYLVIAHRRVYGGGWLVNGIKAATASIVYLVLLFAGLLGILAITLRSLVG
jgi:hypothetical protein